MTDRYDEFLKIQEGLADAKSNLKRNKVAFNEVYDKIKRDISSGAFTLGSKMKDFLFYHVSSDKSDWWKYESLNSEVGKSKGKDILIVTNCERGDFDEGRKDVRWGMYYGVLSGEEMIFNVKSPHYNGPVLDGYTINCQAGFPIGGRGVCLTELADSFEEASAGNEPRRIAMLEEGDILEDGKNVLYFGAEALPHLQNKCEKGGDFSNIFIGDSVRSYFERFDNGRVVYNHVNSFVKNPNLRLVEHTSDLK